MKIMQLGKKEESISRGAPTPDRSPRYTQGAPPYELPGIPLRCRGDLAVPPEPSLAGLSGGLRPEPSGKLSMPPSDRSRCADSGAPNESSVAQI